jgi:hypothetical protein
MRWLEPSTLTRRQWTVQIISIYLSYLQSSRWHTFNQTFPFNKMCPSRLGPYTERNCTKLFKTDWSGQTSPLSPSLPRYNPTGFILLGLCKRLGIPSRSSKCAWTSCTNQQRSRVCDTPDAGKHMAWNRAAFGHSASYKWSSHWDVLNLSRACKWSKQILCVSYALCFVCTSNVNKLRPPGIFVFFSCVSAVLCR